MATAFARSARFVASPFGDSPSAPAATRPPMAAAPGQQRLDLQRHASGHASAASLGLQRSLSRAPSKRSTKCGALSSVHELAMSPSSALESFDALGEALGDFSKLDSVAGAISSVTRAHSLGSLGLAAAAKAAGSSGLGAFLLEKLTTALSSNVLAEALIDKSMLDLFQQAYSALDLDADAFTPGLRLAVAVVIALAGRLLVQAYASNNGADTLRRQLSPAASLSDALADAAAAAVVASSAAAPAPPQHAGSGGLAACLAGAGAAPAPAPGGSFAAVSARLLAARGSMPPLQQARLVGHTLVTSVLLGQAKRLLKLRRKALAVAAEPSPAALLVALEAGVVLHSWSELASGVSALASHVC